MASIQNLVSTLRQAEQALERQLEGIKNAIVALGTGTGNPGPRGRKRGPGRPKGSGNKSIIIIGGKKKRTMSAKARAAISRAQKKRWAKQKAAEKK
jgi:hypothetical protein